MISYADWLQAQERAKQQDHEKKENDPDEQVPMRYDDEIQSDMTTSASTTNFDAREERGTSVYRSYQEQENATFTRRSMLEDDRVSGSSSERGQEPGDDMGRIVAEIRSGSYSYQRQRRVEAMQAKASTVVGDMSSQDGQIAGGGNKGGSFVRASEEQDMVLARQELAPQDSGDGEYSSQEP